MLVVMIVRCKEYFPSLTGTAKEPVVRVAHALIVILTREVLPDEVVTDFFAACLRVVNLADKGDF